MEKGAASSTCCSLALRSTSWYCKRRFCVVARQSDAGTRVDFAASATAWAIVATSAIAPVPTSPHTSVLETGSTSRTPARRRASRGPARKGDVYMWVFAAGATSTCVRSCSGTDSLSVGEPVVLDQSQAAQAQVSKVFDRPAATVATKLALAGATTKMLAHRASAMWRTAAESRQKYTSSASQKMLKASGGGSFAGRPRTAQRVGSEYGSLTARRSCAAAASAESGRPYFCRSLARRAFASWTGTNSHAALVTTTDTETSSHSLLACSTTSVSISQILTAATEPVIPTRIFTI
mmetsp:Transcript_9085/g.28927  ORF Transcript_9085/g.28927 Transcript_9085/m.28927 type:complete len:293 (-) Transcript_9085:48-926(-)